MKSILFLILFIVSFSGTLKCQINRDYTPIINYSTDPEDIKKHLERFKKIASETELNNKTKEKEFKKLLLEGYSDLYREDTSGRLMEGDMLTLYLTSMYQHIQEHNPELENKNLTIYTFRDAEPNASNEGPGVIFFNLGLLERVRNKDEIAFILCHEIAHDYFQHVIKGIEKYCHLYYDPEFQKKKKKILKQPYNRNKDYEKLYLGLLSNEMKHNREDEFKADSMALKFMYEAGYNLNGALTAMNLLDSTDYFFFQDSLLIQKIFNYPDFPFKDQWLKKDGTNTSWTRMNSLYEIPDSLKTHPDCKLRYQKMQHLIQINNWHIDKHKSESVTELTYVASMELLSQLVTEEYYSFALYYALNFYQLDSKNNYINNTISLCLYELAFSIKNHTFSNYTDFPDQDFPVGYNRLLQFLHNMNSKNLRIIFDHFYSENKSSQNESFITDYINAIVKLEHAEYKDQKKIAESYKEKHPQYADFYKKIKYKLNKK